jgi:hypothetical protein
MRKGHLLTQLSLNMWRTVSLKLIDASSDAEQFYPIIPEMHLPESFTSVCLAIVEKAECHG